MIDLILDWLLVFIEEIAEGIIAACSGYWMAKDFRKLYSLEEEAV